MPQKFRWPDHLNSHSLGLDGIPPLCVGDIGFGTGLNFLLTWQARLHAIQTAKETGFSGQIRPLSYLAFERYPLRRSDLSRFLGYLQAENAAPEPLKKIVDRFLEKYPEDFFQGSLRLAWPEEKIELTLVLGDAAEALPQWVKFSPGACTQWGVEAWYLDGFAPRKHLDLWTKDVFSMMAKLSSRSAKVLSTLGLTPSLTTFTAAGWVRRALEEVGYKVERIKGHGRKRQMVKAVYEGKGNVAETEDALPAQPLKKLSTAPWDFLPQRPARLNRTAGAPKAAVVGAGFAGTAMTRALVKAGFEVHLFDKHTTPAQGTSGQRQILTSPLITALRDPLGDLTLMGTMTFIEELRELKLDTHVKGALLCAHDEDETARFESAINQDLLRGSRAEWLTKEAASIKANVTLECQALHLPWIPSFSGLELCEARLRDARAWLLSQGRDADSFLQFHFGERFIPERTEDYDLTFFCGGAAFFRDNVGFDFSWMPLRTVRGQVSFLKENAVSKNLATPVIFDGYLTPGRDGAHVLGSTFQNDDSFTGIRNADHEQMMESLARISPALAGSFQYEKLSAEGQVGFRLMSPDVRPVIGGVPKTKFFKTEYSDLDLGRPWSHYPAAQYEAGQYLFTALGSRGALYSSLFAKALLDLVLGKPSFLTQAQWASVAPSRFLTRPVLRRKLKGGVSDTDLPSQPQ